MNLEVSPPNPEGQNPDAASQEWILSNIRDSHKNILDASGITNRTIAGCGTLPHPDAPYKIGTWCRTEGDIERGGVFIFMASDPMLRSEVDAYSFSAKQGIVVTGTRLSLEQVAIIVQCNNEIKSLRDRGELSLLSKDCTMIVDLQ